MNNTESKELSPVEQAQHMMKTLEDHYFGFSSRQIRRNHKAQYKLYCDLKAYVENGGVTT